MLQDIILIFGCILIGFGILRVLSLLTDNRSPIRGVLIVLIGAGCIYYVFVQNNAELTFSDIPAAVYRIIGKLI